MKVFFKLMLLALGLVIALAAWKLPPMAKIGSGYLAKMTCSEHFVAGRDDLEAIRMDLVVTDPSFEYVEFEVMTESANGLDGVRAWMPLGLGRSTAVYRQGLGCTLVSGVEPEGLPDLDATVYQAVSRFDRNPLTEAASPQPALEAVLDEAFREPAPGSQRNTRGIVVLHHGQLVAERYAEPFTADTPMIGWSMSKSITNNLVGLLVGDGVLELDSRAPVDAWSDPSDVRHGITLRHLLQMSSGLDFAEVYEPGTDATQMLFNEFSTGLFAAESGLAYPPGTHWSYSSGTSNILARIVFEKVGGTADAMYGFMHERLFGPLGLESIQMEPDSSGSPVGSSFTYATVRDWAKLGQFWLQDGVWNGQRILPEGWMAWSASAAPAAPRGEYGAQFWLDAGKDGQHRSWPDLPDNLYMANGFNGQHVVVFPDKEIVVVRLGLTSDNSWNLGDFLLGVYQALNH